MKNVFLVLLLVLPLLSWAEDVTVFAASSLTDVLSTVGKMYEQEKKEKILFNFDASSRLAKQISEGAKANIFFSADKEWNKVLEQKKMIASGNSKDLLSNELVIVSHVSQSFKISDLKKLGEVKFKHLCLAQESVPAGKYAYESLNKLGVLSSVKARIVHGDSVRNVLAWAAKNEADLAVVFATDAKVEPKVKELIRFPSELHSPIIYPVSLIGSKPSAKAIAFYQYLQTQKVLAVFKDAGFKIFP